MTLRDDRQRDACEVQGQLECSYREVSFTLTVAHRMITLAFADFGEILRCLHPRRSYRRLVRQLRDIKSFLDQTRMTLEVRIRHQQVAAMGYGVGHPIWRMFGFPAVSLQPVRIIRLAAREWTAPR